MERSNPVITIKGSFIALGGTVFIAAILLLFTSNEPLESLRGFFITPFMSSYYIGNMLNNAALLILAGLGISIAFRGGLFNLGGEGQIYFSAFTATIIGIWLPGELGIFGIIIMLFAAFLTGALVAVFSAALKIKWNTDELITSFLISSALVLVVDYFITGPFRDVNSNLMTTEKVDESFRFIRLMPPSNLDVGIIFVLILAVLFFIFLFFSTWGYKIRMSGLNREFARYGGISVPLYMIIPFFLSGGLHGLAGAFSILGTHYSCIKGFSAGLGWNGIAVALIARNHPLAVIPAALVFSYLQVGSQTAMIGSDFNFEINTIIQAAVFFLITIQFGRRSGDK